MYPRRNLQLIGHIICGKLWGLFILPTNAPTLIFRFLLDSGEGLRLSVGDLGFLWHFTHLDCDLDQIENTNLDFHLCTVPRHHPCPRTSIVILEERFVQRVGIPRYPRRDNIAMHSFHGRSYRCCCYGALVYNCSWLFSHGKTGQMSSPVLLCTLIVFADGYYWIVRLVRQKWLQ